MKSSVIPRKPVKAEDTFSISCLRSISLLSPQQKSVPVIIQMKAIKVYFPIKMLCLPFCACWF